MSGGATGGNSQSIHGHAILRQLAATPMTREAITARAQADFGAAARYHTCDAQGLSFDALFDLLVARGKLVAEGDRWATQIEQVCADE